MVAERAFASPAFAGIEDPFVRIIPPRTLCRQNLEQLPLSQRSRVAADLDSTYARSPNRLFRLRPHRHYRGNARQQPFVAIRYTRFPAQDDTLCRHTGAYRRSVEA